LTPPQDVFFAGKTVLVTYVQPQPINVRPR
jgi:hypothetical protein